jgi:hypothetical protein
MIAFLQTRQSLFATRSVALTAFLGYTIATADEAIE